MSRAQRSIALVSVSALLGAASAGCAKKDEAASKPAVQGDGGSMTGPLALAMGKPVEGTLCPGPTWFAVVPPADAQIKYELQIPKGAGQFCTHLNARSAKGALLDSTVSLCSDNPQAFATGQAPFGKDVVFFTIDPNDPAEKCVPARFRLSLAKAP